MSLLAMFCAAAPVFAAPCSTPSATSQADKGAAEPEVVVNKKGLGKEVIVSQGAHEWYMLVEVTPDNTVVVRQHKQGETYLVDESETHDRSLVPQEVDDAIADFVSSARTQLGGCRP